MGAKECQTGTSLRTLRFPGHGVALELEGGGWTPGDETVVSRIEEYRPTNVLDYGDEPR